MLGRAVDPLEKGLLGVGGSESRTASVENRTPGNGLVGRPNILNGVPHQWPNGGINRGVLVVGCMPLSAGSLLGKSV